MDAVDMETAITKITEFALSSQPHLVVTLGVEMVMRAQHDEVFRKTVLNADLVTPDTVGVVWAANLQGANLKERVAGIELSEKLFPLCVANKWRIFLLGSEPGIAQKAAENLLLRFPELTIAGYEHGYFKDSQEIINKIKETSPHFLLIGMGSPRQELWFRKHQDDIKVPVGIGVGGSLDVWAGKCRRVPAWIIKLKLEWLIRVLGNPNRWKRALALPLFVFEVIRAKIFIKE